MKQSVEAIIIVLGILLFSCSSKKENTSFSGVIKGLSKGTIYLKKVEDSTVIIIDSVKVKGSDSFNFSLAIEEPDVYLLHLDKKDAREFSDMEEIFLEPKKEIKLSTQLNNFSQKINVKGSENHRRLTSYKKVLVAFNKERFKIVKKSIEPSVLKNNDSIEFYTKKLALNLKRKYLYTTNFALSNKDYEIAPYVIVKEIPDASTKYIDTVYSSLTKKIKNSKYGKQLKEIIDQREENI